MNNNDLLPQGVLFDLDGVLIDTENQYSEFWAKTGRNYGVTDSNFASHIKGTNLQAILNTFFPDQSTHKSIISELNEFQKNMKYEICPGVREFIAALDNHNIPSCIVTSSDQKKMNELFRQQPFFKQNFKSIVTGDQVSKGKPDPECFIKGAEKIGCDINQCVVFEDSIQGITAGSASGAIVIALSTTFPIEKISTVTNNIISGFSNFSIEQLSLYYRKRL